MPPRKWCTQRRWEINLEQKAGGGFSTLISPCELHKEQDDIGFITAEHWWRAGWAKVLTRGNERVISHWLGAHHGRSRMLRGRWPLSCDCLDEETYGGAKYGGGVKHIQLGHNIQEKGKSPHAFSPTHAHTYIYTPTPTHTVHTAHSAHICLYRQFDGDDDGDDAGRTLAAFRWLMSSVSFSAVFHPPLESIWCTSPTYINVMYQTVRARENRAAATILPFFAEFYYLCLSHLQALVHKCSCVLSIRFYQLCEVDCTRRSLKVTVPCEQQLFKMIYWYILHAHFIGITLVLVTVFYAWIDLMVS